MSYQWLLLRAALEAHGNDFGKFYFAVQKWMAGGSLYEPNLATRIQAGSVTVEFLNMNPPHFHLLLLPFTLLPLAIANALWMTLNVLAGLAAALMVVRTLRLPFKPLHVLPVACVFLIFAATGAIAATGQFTGLLMLPMTTAWREARAGRWTQSGIWLGVLVGVKPFLGLFLPALLVMGRWRAAVAMCVSAAACFAVGIVTFGVGPHIEWIGALRDVSWLWSRMNGSLMALLARSLAPSPDFTPIAALSSLVAPLWIVGSAFIVAMTMAIARRSVDHAFGGVVLGSLLVSPLGWVYYLWLALPGCLALWQERLPTVVAVGLIPLSVPLVLLLWGQPNPLATITIASAYSWGTIALWCGVASVREARTMVR